MRHMQTLAHHVPPARIDKRKRNRDELEKDASCKEQQPLIPQHKLDIEGRRRTSLFSWNGQFSPELVDIHLCAYASAGDVVWDPFTGSGTVLFECARLGIQGHGTDVNPAALVTARIARLANLTASRRMEILNPLGVAIASQIRTSTQPVEALYELRAGLSGHEQEVLEALLLRLADTASTTVVHRAWQTLRNLVVELPYTAKPITADLCDARATSLGNSSVNLIITSPPYINVFNYHQQHRRAVEKFGWRVLSVASSEIGANRKHRSNRLLTVVQYCLDMAAALHEMRRVCTPTARVILVVGKQSNVLKTAFYNSKIVTKIATAVCGFALLLTQERSFKNRFGQLIIEDILHFSLAADDVVSLTTPAAVAVEALTEAKQRAPAECRTAFDLALCAAAVVKPSPLLDVHAIRNQ